MNMLPCCSTQDNGSFKERKALNPMISTRQGSVFSSFVKNMSRKIGSSRQRHITDHIRKVGIAKVSLQAFTYQEVVAATDDFNPDGRLGEGGFGNVYRGYMENINQVVAVKQLNRNGQQGSREFLTEVLMLSLVQHENLVQLLGYCADDDHRILVYEYMQNDSLEKHLFDLRHGKEPLDWTTRMKIALGAAQGLAYLHDEANPQIIYRDFKASNILLDGDFNPRLSDFGLAKLGPKNGLRHVSTRVMGTFGYCAPEYQQTGQLTAKSDVYSFGVVFLEILSGRRAIDIERPTEEQNLIYWAEPLFKDKNMFTVMADPLLEGNYPVKSLYQALAVAAMCLQEEADTRPLMADVVSALRFLAMPECMEKSPTVASTKSASLYAADAEVEDVKEDRCIGCVRNGVEQPNKEAFSCKDASTFVAGIANCE